MAAVSQIPWAQTVAIFLGTLPLLFVIAWNLIDVKAMRTEMRTEFAAIRSEMRAEFAAIRAELAVIRADIASIRERVATLEERDRLTHPVIR